MIEGNRMFMICRMKNWVYVSSIKMDHTLKYIHVRCTLYTSMLAPTLVYMFLKSLAWVNTQCNGLCGQQFRFKLFVRLKMNQQVSQMISFVIAYGFPFDCIGKHMDQLRSGYYGAHFPHGSNQPTHFPGFASTSTLISLLSIQIILKSSFKWNSWKFGLFRNSSKNIRLKHECIENTNLMKYQWNKMKWNEFVFELFYLFSGLENWTNIPSKKITCEPIRTTRT